jgi:hypothetical protein
MCTPLVGERVEVRRQRGHQRLALAGGHLGDRALVQHHAADQLHVEVPHARAGAARLAADRERLGRTSSTVSPSATRLRSSSVLPARPASSRLLHIRLERVDLGDDRAASA